ncbi:5'-3' exonuclease H3TH domain-containing protein [uncultured Pseudokineococcus sp.]|uniref:5'-3' exonuclease n=1 Tax=uncultured Pseudokineococcus sp. TaxID=1642928 RepID=UPI002616982A|nr:5'-3' exonuclease H3TH domain-containing protein [uncultured Pseudokineococcus sp.]
MDARTTAPGPSGPLLLLDAASMYFRAYHGIPDSVAAPDGTPVNALRGFLDMTARLVADRRPGGLVACWDDDWRPQWRVDAVPSYKAHRVAADGGEDAPRTLGPQVPVIAEALAAVGVPRVGAPGCEADDVIGTLATRAVAAGRAVEVVTGDRDLFQLAGRAGAPSDGDGGGDVLVLYTSRGIRDLELVDGPRLRERYGVADGDRYADLAVLRGDASDGLPGVPGVGEKTAATLLERFGDLNGVRAAVRDRDPSLRPAQLARLAEAADYLDAAPAVVRVLRDADLPEHDDALPAEVADPAAVTALARRYGVASSLRRLLVALGLPTDAVRDEVVGRR